MEYWDDGILVI